MREYCRYTGTFRFYRKDLVFAAQKSTSLMAEILTAVKYETVIRPFRAKLLCTTLSVIILAPALKEFYFARFSLFPVS